MALDKLSSVEIKNSDLLLSSSQFSLLLQMPQKGSKVTAR